MAAIPNIKNQSQMEMILVFNPTEGALLKYKSYWRRPTQIQSSLEVPYSYTNPTEGALLKYKSHWRFPT